jgi:hypothetical protein
MSHLIDDTNYLQFLNEHYGRTDGLAGLIPRDYEAIPFGSMPYTAPFSASVPIIPESEWPARIAAMQGRFIRNLYTDTVPDKSQGQLPYCWAWSLCQCIESGRAIAGMPTVSLAPVSLGGSVGFRRQGNYCGAAIEYAAEHGACDDIFPDSQYSLTPSRWRTGWQEEAKNHRVAEFWELGNTDMWKETVTALLCGFSVYVGYNFWSHAVMLDELVIQGSEICVSGPNSWGPGQRFVLKGSRKVPSEAYVVRTTVFSNS